MTVRWYDEVWQQHLRYGLAVTRTLFSGHSAHQRIEILDTPHAGRVLALDGVFMTSERDEHYYHEMLVHPALCCAASAERVLIIGGGDGGSARQVLRHDRVRELVMVEIDDLVVEACREHLPSLGAWDDPRLELIIGDGVAYARDAPAAAFDVVILDGTDPVGPGQGLFDRAFYASIARLLRPGGVFALQSESPILMPALFADIQRALAGAFARVDPYFAPVPLYAAGTWSFTFCAAAADWRAPEPALLAAIEPACRYYNRDLHRAAFAQSNEVRRLLEPVRDLREA
jgi:spermidine synthase